MRPNSSIHFLPPETLCEIFSNVLESHDPSILPSNDSILNREHSLRNITLVCHFWKNVAFAYQPLWRIVIVGDPIRSSTNRLAAQLERAGEHPLEVVITAKAEHADERGPQTTRCLEMLKAKALQWRTLTMAIESEVFSQEEARRLLPDVLPQLQEAAIRPPANTQLPELPQAPQLRRYTSLGTPWFPFERVPEIRTVVPDTLPTSFLATQCMLANYGVEILELIGTGGDEERFELAQPMEFPTVTRLELSNMILPRALLIMSSLITPNLTTLLINVIGTSGVTSYGKIRLPGLALLQIKGAQLRQVRKLISTMVVPAGVTLELPVSVATLGGAATQQESEDLEVDRRWLEARCRIRWIKEDGDGGIPSR